jgi:hypothetical protein
MANIIFQSSQTFPESVNEYLDQAVSHNRDKIDLGIKAVALNLLYATPGLPSIAKYAWIESVTGICNQSLRRIAKKAKERGYDPTTNAGQVLSKYLIDDPRSGRPNAAVNEINKKRCIEIISKDRNGREKSAEIVGIEIGISRQSVYRIMRKANVTST